MSRPRFYSSDIDLHLGSVKLSKDELRHLKDSLRLKEGAKAEVFDGLGSLYLLEIDEIKKDGASGRLIEKIKTEDEPRLKVGLFQAVLKGQAMDTVIQKATEMGADLIQPILTERTVVSIPPKQIHNKAARWQRIAVEAAKQSKRLFLPKVNPPVELKSLKSEIESFDRFILFYEEEKGKSVKNIDPKGVSSIGIMIGPEGGFTFGEVERMHSLGAEVASLGRNILKADTAAIAALAVILHEFGGGLLI